MHEVRLLLALLLFVLLPFSGHAQKGVRRGCCTPHPTDEVTAARRDVQRRLQIIDTEWDATRTYKQLVILISFSDTDFRMENPRETYDRMFNEKGYNQGEGAGSVADYFRDQSQGLFNIKFDVYGPYRVNSKAQPYENPTEDTVNYGTSVLREATNLFLQENGELDYSPYDWNGDGYLEQVIYVCAGYGGNQDDEKCYGHIWPNTSYFAFILTPDGKKIQNYTASAELWTNNTSCGIGTICHEFSHSLGLPDIYPVNGWAYSTADEWDLMDGGNFTNSGWCPPNYTAMEKMLMGWLTPTELTEATTITGMKPVDDGGKAYIIKNTNAEYLLLENRQWAGWDAGLPGKGLVIYHVDYLKSAWSGNEVNNTKNHLRFDLVHADNKDYAAWRVIIGSSNWYADAAKYMHNRFLSTSPYPYTSDDATQTNRVLTDNSTPATVMYNKNASNSTLLSKPITNIQMSDDGLISFDFMGDDPTGIRNLTPDFTPVNDGCLIDLQGRRVERPSKGLYIQNGKLFVIK